MSTLLKFKTANEVVGTGNDANGTYNKDKLFKLNGTAYGDDELIIFTNMPN